MTERGANTGQMWGGRFQGSLDAAFHEFQKSLPVDHVLAYADLETNLAWSEALVEAGIFTADEFARIREAIDALAEHWAAHGVPVGDPAEDVHSLVERELIARCGDLGKRIHLGRSRNDQVATDLRLYLRERIFGCLGGLEDLCSSLVSKAEQHWQAPMPGYTHLQRAQPIAIGHHALSHVEALARDRERFLDAFRRMDQCPLGSGALAGTTLAIDREALAGQLGFRGGPTRNSLDATAARDHVCELAFACAMTMTHLSRLAEDYIFFATHEARFLTFGDAVSTGSSLMPQKRNPDAMELVRGKAGRVQGALMALLATVKGLPMAYNRDLQTDKETLLPAMFETEACLHVTALAVRQATFDAPRCAAEAERGYLNATDLADLLVGEGVPFREAHGIVGAAVNRAVELGVELQDLPAAEQQRLLPQLRCDLRTALAAPAVLARRQAIGGTAPVRVKAEVERWQILISEWATGSTDSSVLSGIDDDDEEPADCPRD
ncbi:MAG TPA: argininosuccinate lyase [Planctomycetota bacterium]|nr:argininosuccinate lyase [Planctomycetota bacterium]